MEPTKDDYVFKQSNVIMKASASGSDNLHDTFV